MKALKNLMNRLTAEGRDITELERMINDLTGATTVEEITHSENRIYGVLNQIYGVLVGLSILGYITPDEVNDIQNAIEEEGI